MEGVIFDEDQYERGSLLPASGSGIPEHPTMKKYQSVLGSLLWIARCTRLNISFAFYHASRRAHAPTIGDFKLSKRIGRYFAGSADFM